MCTVYQQPKLQPFTKKRAILPIKYLVDTTLFLVGSIALLL